MQTFTQQQILAKAVSVHYAKRYLAFISAFHNTGGKIKHHILPKSVDCFPEYSSFIKNPWNCALLTERQHFVAHWLLWKALGGSQMHAFWSMKHKMGEYLNSRSYEVLRKELGSKISSLNRGRKDSFHTKQKKSLSRQGVLNPNFGKEGVWKGKKRPEHSANMRGKGLGNTNGSLRSAEGVLRCAEAASKANASGGNPSAKPISYLGKIYGCIRDAEKETGHSRPKIKKECIFI